MLKILQDRPQQYMNWELPDVHTVFRKDGGARDQIVNICWIIEKARELQKIIYFCFLDYTKDFDCVSQQTQKLLKKWEYQITISTSWETRCFSEEEKLEATVRTWNGTTDWFKIWKGVCQGCILSPCLFNFYAECTMQNVGLDEAQAGIKIAGRHINNLRYAGDITLMAESEEELKSLLVKVKEESEKAGLKLNIQETKTMTSSPITSWQIYGEKLEIVGDFIFLVPNHYRQWLQSWN